MKLASADSRLRAAFTLIEVVIGSSLMSLILVSGYLLFSASIETRKTMEPRLEVVQSARVAMAMVASDLRSACPLDRNFAFLGMHRTMGDQIADNLDFATHNYTPQRPGEGDYCQISYYLDENPATKQLSLWRRRNPAIAPDSLSGGSKEEIAAGLAGLRFEYSDGLEWFDDWGDTSTGGKRQTSEKAAANLSGMPKAVRITMWFYDLQSVRPADLPASTNGASGPTLKFQTVARLNLAESSNSASSGSGSDAASQGDSSGGQMPGGGGQQ